jgi:hypothetical protein
MYSNVAKVGSVDSKYMNIFDRFLSEASVSVTVTGVSPIADSQYVSVESSNKNSTTWAVSSYLLIVLPLQREVLVVEIVPG